MHTTSHVPIASPISWRGWVDGPGSEPATVRRYQCQATWPTGIEAKRDARRLFCRLFPETDESNGLHDPLGTYAFGSEPTRTQMRSVASN